MLTKSLSKPPKREFSERNLKSRLSPEINHPCLDMRTVSKELFYSVDTLTFYPGLYSITWERSPIMPSINNGILSFKKPKAELQISWVEKKQKQKQPKKPKSFRPKVPCDLSQANDLPVWVTSAHFSAFALVVPVTTTLIWHTNSLLSWGFSMPSNLFLLVGLGPFS